MSKTIHQIFSLSLLTLLILPNTFVVSAQTTTAVIKIDTAQVLHPADSHVLGTNRNHVANDFPNGAAKLEKMKELQPTWGGGKYLYRVGHSAFDGRNDYDYMPGYHFEQYWDKDGEYPYDDLRHALQDANTMGADQIHAVNFGTSNPDEAGRYVSFLNKANDANRAAHPIAQQNVQLFEVGTEVSWDMVRGHDQYAPNETAYATRAKLFAQKMRTNSDIPIKIGLVAGTNSNWEGNGWSGGAQTVDNIIKVMGNDVDFLIFHGYPSWPVLKPDDPTTMMAQNEWNKQKIEGEIKPAIQQAVSKYGLSHGVDIYNTEMFTEFYNNATFARAMLGAMYSADSIILAMNENLHMAIQFCLDHGDMADQSFWYGDDPNNTTAVFKLQKLIAKHWGDNILSTSGQNIPVKAVAGADTTINTPRLAFSAAKTGNNTYVLVVNRFNDQDVQATVDLGSTTGTVTAYELSGTNGWNSTNADVKTISNPSLTNYKFNHATVTLFEITGGTAPTLTLTPTPASTCQFKNKGDANCDNLINAADFIIWKSEFISPSTEQFADFTNDTKINLIDFETWRGNAYP